MENILSCQPKDLPKLADKTILTLPVTVSVAMPMEKISFWQSSVAFGVFFALFLPTFLIWLVLLLANALYHSVELAKDINVMFYTFIAMFLFIIGVGFENRNKSFLSPNLFLAKKIKWKTIPIMIIDSQKIVLTDYFTVEKKVIIFDEINKFYLHSKGRGTPAIGFMIDSKDKKLNKSLFDVNPYIVPYNRIVIGSHSISLRELLNLMNPAKKTNDAQITFLSMNNYENVIDIGW